jgi:hypothetical protein
VPAKPTSIGQQHINQDNAKQHDHNDPGNLCYGRRQGKNGNDPPDERKDYQENQKRNQQTDHTHLTPIGCQLGADRWSIEHKHERPTEVSRCADRGGVAAKEGLLKTTLAAGVDTLHPALEVYHYMNP